MLATFLSARIEDIVHGCVSEEQLEAYIKDPRKTRLSYVHSSPCCGHRLVIGCARICTPMMNWQCLKPYTCQLYITPSLSSQELENYK